ncbi:MAG: ABC transporter ATP-binding protein [Anaerolineae bacterium]|nr:ABC transporter ATP-binding protein [Anaerolineae bacterium]MDW8100728.1 ABC transporter ATP-binding protein [Anaerolineae bacterium]
MSGNLRSNTTLLNVENLVLYFRTSRGVVQAVDSVSFDLKRNEALVILGESGCGKTSLARALLRLLPRNVHTFTGKIYLDGQNVMDLDEEAFRREIRWLKISFVPQAAMNALNPVLRVGDQVAEPLIQRLGLSRDKAMSRVREAFQRVGVPEDFLSRYAFELSGGMRQRVAIAMALVTEPDLVLLDEPTSALDVLTQANIMNVLKHIKRERNTGFILITHDISISSELADRVATMYAGQIVELSDAAQYFTRPYHPYAQGLMASVPRVHEWRDPMFIPGQPPSLLSPPKGCRFADRCSARFDKCNQEPPMYLVGDRHWVKCWLYERETRPVRLYENPV